MFNELEISVQVINTETVVISLSGDVTHCSDAVIHQAYAQACDLGAANIILDFTAGDYVDTPAMAILIDLIVQAHRRRQRLLMAVPSSYLRRIFAVVGITQYATVVDNLAEAKDRACDRASLPQTINMVSL